VDVPSLTSPIQGLRGMIRKINSWHLSVTICIAYIAFNLHNSCDDEVKPWVSISPLSHH